MPRWEQYTLAELAAPAKAAMATGPFGSAVSSKNFRSVGVPMLRGSNLSFDIGTRLDENDLVYLDRDLAARFGRSVARRGDLVFTCWGTVGQIGFIDNSSTHESYVVSNKQMKMTPDCSQVEPLFLYYYLSQIQMIDLVVSQAIGSSVPGFNLGQLKTLTVCIPHVREQCAIAEVLGALDDKIATNTQLATTACELAGLIFDGAVMDQPMCPMSSVLTPVLGGTPPRAREDYWGGDVLWASARDVTGAPFGVVVDTQDRITELATAQTKAKPLPIGSVILTARGTVGAVARLGTPSSLNQSCYGFAPGRLPAGALYFSVLRATERAKAFAHGSVFDTITMRTFDHLEIADMASDEWRAIEAQIEPLLASITQVVMENQQLGASRDALLPQLMSGKLRVKDAERIAEDAL